MNITKNGRNRSIARAAATALALAFLLLAAGCEDLMTPVVLEDVRLAGLPERTLTILAPSNGTSTPVGAIRLKDGEPFQVSASANVNFAFDFWLVSDGDGTPTFDNDRAATTTVRLSGGDATIVAMFNDTLDPTGTISIPDRINVDGTYYLKTKAITVNLTYSDNSSVSQMRLSESSFAEGAPTGWIAANTTTSYTFASDGAKTLYVRFKDDGGNESNLYSATVKIDSTAPVPSTYQIERIDPDPLKVIFPTYVWTYNTNLRLNYLASDGTGSGMAKVYFSNTSTRPAGAQVNPYPTGATPYTYPWSITSDPYGQGDYTVRFWFEDRLGNVSAAFTDTVRFDDRYEGDYGNNSIDATSGATMIIDSYPDNHTLANFYSPSWGSAYLVDQDYYKWGFYALDSSSTYPVTVTIWMNDIITSEADMPVVTFYDANEDDVAATPDDWVNGSQSRTYTLDMPYVNTGGHEYYFYMRVGRSVAEPYADPPNYTVTWSFDENE